MSRRRAPGKIDRRHSRSRSRSRRGARGGGGGDGGWAAAVNGSDPILHRVAASHAMGRWFAEGGRDRHGRPFWPWFLFGFFVLFVALAIIVEVT